MRRPWRLAASATASSAAAAAISGWSLAAILVFAVASSPAWASKPAAGRVVVAANAIDTGSEVNPDNFVLKPRPAGLPDAAVIPESAFASVLGKRTLQPLGKGEPLRPSQLPSYYSTQTWKHYCDLLPEALRTRNDPTRPYPKRMSVERSPVLAAAVPLAAGTVIQAQHLKAVTLPPEVAGPYAVSAHDRASIVGKKLIDPLVPGEVLRYPAVVEYVNEARCRWMYLEFGNAHVDHGPADATAVVCPHGTTAVSGIPGGDKWVPTLPGWALVCRRPDGTRQGPYLSWHRNSAEKFEVGQFTDGLRSGSWQQFNPQGRLQQQRTFVRGVMQGLFARWTYKMTQLVGGQYESGLRSGAWTFADWDGPIYLKAEFQKGLPRGTWSFADTNGSPLGTGNFGRNGLPNGRWATINWANKETGWVDYVDGKPGKVMGPQPFKLEAVYYTARALEPGTVVTKADVKPVMIPATFGIGDFVRASDAGEVIGKPVLAPIPAGALLFRMDFDLDNDAWKTDPVPK